jgi:hypothetical protein
MRTRLLCTVLFTRNISIYDGHGLTGLKLFSVGELVVHQYIPLKCRGILSVLP